MSLQVNVVKEPPTDTITLTYYATDRTDRWRQNFKEMYQEGVLCDVTLVAENHEFRCHRLVLAASSDYFRAMFTADFLEKGADKVDMPIGRQYLKDIVEYIYLGEIEVKKDDVQELFVAAHMLGMTELQFACAGKLRTHMDHTNCASLYFFSSFYDSKELKDYAKNYACRHLQDVLKEQSNVELTAEQLPELVGFTDIENRAFCEDAVYQCIWRWLEHDWEMRQQYVEQLMQHVKLRHLSDEVLHQVADNPRLKHVQDVQTQINKLKYIKLYPNRLDTQ